MRLRLKDFLSLLMVFIAGMVISAFLSTTLQLTGLGLILGIFTICWIHFIRGYQWMYANLRTGFVFIIGYSLMFLPNNIVFNLAILVLLCIAIYMTFLYKKVTNEKAMIGVIELYHETPGPDLDGDLFAFVNYEDETGNGRAIVKNPTEEIKASMKQATEVETHLFYQKVDEIVIYEKKDFISQLIAIFEGRILKKIKI